MANIRPFRGVVYNQSKIGSLQNVVTPPYDVISERMQNYFYNLSPYNIIRIILGKESDNDTPRNNRYTRAQFFFEGWLKKNVFIRDKKPSIYVYRQSYLYEEKKRARIGFIALMKIEDPHKSGVLPHEYTLDKPKIDRFNLIKKVKANLSPIFSLYYDKDLTISRLLRKAIKNGHSFETVELEGVSSQLWQLTDKRVISVIKNKMRDKKIFIADGHHRYEVALMYKKMMSRQKRHNNSSDYVMMYFTNLYESNNVTILSTHRVLKNTEGLDIKKALKTLKRYFSITVFNNIDTFLAALAKDKERTCFGMYKGKSIYYLLTLKKNTPISKIIKSEKSPEWKKLDVTILHNLVIKDLLSLKDSEDNIKYVRDPKDVAELIDSGRYKVAFFLNPTKIQQVKEVAEKRDMLPHKSTYFYPKLLTGLVINKF